MVTLDEKYRAQGLEILAFPCNQFGSQEPGTKEEIRKFVDGYGVKFQMFEKIKVNGSGTHPLYSFLKKQKSSMLTGLVKWNFTKFLVDREGNVVKRFGPQTSLLSKEDEIREVLEKTTE